MNSYAISLNDVSTPMSNRTPEEIFDLKSYDILAGIIRAKPTDLYQLESMAKILLLDHLKDLISFVNVDIYNKINYTCEYLLNSTDSQLNYLEMPTHIWYEDSTLMDENNYYERIFTNHSNLSLPFSGLFMFTGDKINGSFYVPELCNKFSFYIYENLTSLIWYTPKDAKRTQHSKYLLSTLLKVDKYNFTDSDFYLFECLTNVHSVITISDVIYRALPYQALENLLKENLTNEEEQYAFLLDKLISVIASSPLIYSKSMILSELFSHAEELFNIKTDFVFLMTYVTLQFELLDKYLREVLPLDEVSKKHFGEFLDFFAKENPQSDKSHLYTLVKEKNLNTFKKHYSQASQWLSPRSLIQNIESENKELAYNLKKTQHTSTALAYANVYVQKKFQDALSGKVIIDDSSSNFSEDTPRDENGNLFIIRESSADSNLSCTLSGVTTNE